MRTALRTYHPVPSLQTEDISRKEMSDAPRLKAMLKAAILDWEVKNPPTTLKDVARRSVSFFRSLPAALHPFSLPYEENGSSDGSAVVPQVSPDLTRGPPTTVIEAIFLIFQEASVSLLRP